jgi:ATP-binding cassette, subfamily B, bacterial
MVGVTVGFIAVVGEGVANLLEPWPLKIVLDSVLRPPVHGWLNHFIQSTVGDDKLAILKFACAAMLGIAILDALSSYTEKYLTTSRF